MTNFLLIHGAAHGAWCWRDVLPLLQAQGHSARAIDLPSHGADKTPYTQVGLGDYARAIVEAIHEPTVLVGHSMGGYPITLAAELAPEKVQALIYVCAYVPAPGLSLSQMRMQAPRQPLLPFIRMREDGQGWGIDRDDLHALFYHDCPPGTVDYAAENLCIQATRPTAEPVPLHHSLALPCYYVRCADDRTIPPEFQITMTQDWPADHVATMACAHSPFFADPQGLADILSDFGKGH